MLGQVGLGLVSYVACLMLSQTMLNFNKKNDLMNKTYKKSSIHNKNSSYIGQFTSNFIPWKSSAIDQPVSNSLSLGP